MNKDKLIKPIAIIVIIFAVLISGYLIISSNKKTSDQNQNTVGLAPMVDEKQVIKMTVHSVSYDPNYFKIKAGIPVRWEVTSSGQPGCDSGALVANGLLQSPMYLNPNAGQVSVAEFTAQQAGTYKFSCTMGMVKGTIEVIN